MRVAVWAVEPLRSVFAIAVIYLQAVGVKACLQVAKIHCSDSAVGQLLHCQTVSVVAVSQLTSASRLSGAVENPRDMSCATAIHGSRTPLNQPPPVASIGSQGINDCQGDSKTLDL